MPFPQHNLRCRIAAFVAMALVLTSAAVSLAASTGEQVYKDQCARCHGKAGEGTDDNYPVALEGDKSVAQLTKLIHETMPEDAEMKTLADDAATVAQYIYDSFYSPEARVRNKPARIELSRLTVRQYQNAVADLIGSFLPKPKPESNAEQGLRGTYFQSGSLDPKFKDKEKYFKRVDPQIDFDFGDSGPDPKQLDADEFSMRWQGSVLAPDTGEYEFVIRTQHAARLYVNDMKSPLIDAWIRSGDDAEHREAIRLLGGRQYPIRIEFSKINQGVKDEKFKGNQPKFKAFFSLAWKRPDHALEIIPSRSLSTADSPEVFVVQARFPPDDRSVGYERGTSISKAWDEASTDGAIEVASYVADNLEKLVGASADKADSAKKLRRFCVGFAERAFRRPLPKELKQLYVDRQFAKGGDAVAQVKRVVLLVMKSPRFLYREVGDNTTDPYDVASRLSFGLWDSLPDNALLSAAKSGKLTTRAEIDSQLSRMLPDLRTRSKLRDFFLVWLKISQPRDLSKDPQAFPEFTPEVISDLRTSIELSLDDLLDSNSADFRQFLLSDDMHFNGRLAKLYGVNLAENSPFQKVDFEPNHRAGVLSHPYLLASLAYTNSSSPIHRGVFLSRSVLGRVLRPPAEAIAPLPPELHADLSNRERVALQTQPESCQGCHSMINPLGFTMENFDAIGRYRESDKNKPIDATGSYLTQSGEVMKFNGGKDLARFLANSEESQKAFVKQLFHHTVKQPIRAYGPTTLDDLQKTFAENGYNIHKLLLNIVAASAMTK